MEGLNIRWAVGYVSLESKGEVWGTNLRVSDIYVYLLILQCLRKGMETHSGVLAWRIPHTEKPGGLHAMALQRVGQDWSNYTFIFFQATLRRRSPRKCVGREEPRENQCFGAQVKSCKRDWKGVIHTAKVILASTETKRWKSVSRRRELSTELNADMRSSSTKRVLLGNMEKESVTVIEPSRGMVGLNWVLLCWGYIRMDWKVHGNE